MTPASFSKSSSPSQGRVNTIGLESTALAQLLENLDRAGGESKRALRDFVRWPFRKARILVRFDQSGASPILALACRNLSRGGVSLLHNRYLHTRTPVTVMLPLPAGGARPVKGEIARCAHRSGIIHEIGIRFESPINVREFIGPVPLPDFLTLERVDPESLQGFVLCITPSESDARIVRHFLRITRMAVRTAATAEEAVALLREPFSAVIADMDGPELSSGAFAGVLRAHGCRAPLVLLSGSPGAARAGIAAAGPDAILTKPLSQDRLLRCLGECQLNAGLAAAR